MAVDGVLSIPPRVLLGVVNHTGDGLRKRREDALRYARPAAGPPRDTDEPECPRRGNLGPGYVGAMSGEIFDPDVADDLAEELQISDDCIQSFCVEKKRVSPARNLVPNTVRAISQVPRGRLSRPSSKPRSLL